MSEIEWGFSDAATAVEMCLWWQMPKCELQNAKCIRLNCVLLFHLSHTHSRHSGPNIGFWRCIALHWLFKITHNSTLSIIVINCIGTVIKVMYQLTWNTFIARQHSTAHSLETWVSTRLDSEVSESCDRDFASAHLNNKQPSMSVILKASHCMGASECYTIRDAPYNFFVYVDFIHFVCVNKTTIANLNGGSNAI